FPDVPERPPSFPSLPKSTPNVFVVWLRLSPRHFWAMQLIEPNRKRAELLGRRWLAQAVDSGRTTTEVGLEQRIWGGGDVTANFPNRRHIKMIELLS
ncbi:hypothetical protein LCGC14_2750510, partial [marine sediment metagenome]